ISNIHVAGAVDADPAWQVEGRVGRRNAIDRLAVRSAGQGADDPGGGHAANPPVLVVSDQQIASGIERNGYRPRQRAGGRRAPIAAETSYAVPSERADDIGCAVDPANQFIAVRDV